MLQSAQLWLQPQVEVVLGEAMNELGYWHFLVVNSNLMKLQIEADTLGNYGQASPARIHASQIIVGPTVFGQPWRALQAISPIRHQAETVSNLLCQLKNKRGGWEVRRGAQERIRNSISFLI